jgi:anti-anti-sigma regulatory factor
MLRIRRSANGEVLFTLSGQMDEESIAELETLINSESNRRRIVLDLKDLTLANEDAIRFLVRCEANSITLENCPAYVREWINAQRRES